MKLNQSFKETNLLGMLICLTLLFIAAQVIFFSIHYKVSELVDSLVQHSITRELFYPIILLPIIEFIIVQLAAYGLMICFAWFLARSIGVLFHLAASMTYWLGLIIWVLCCVEILTLNHYFFPDSYFSQWFHQPGWAVAAHFNLIFASILLLLATLLAYLNFFSFTAKSALSSSLRIIGKLFLFLGFINIAMVTYDNVIFLRNPVVPASKTPNIILIGFDSLRPDFTSYFGNHAVYTPNIDRFLRNATIFTDVYTPLARTFPTWVSILTAKHPKHNHARNNLAAPEAIFAQENLAKTMKQAGYETIYATDEKRFSNITEAFGFDRILGPKTGVNDFLLGGLGDFPLANLLINSPWGRFLFPYNYANRAASITYEPDKFLHLIHLGLLKRQNKPLFLAIHFCVTHWPFRWAHAGQFSNDSLVSQYENSIAAVDEQFGKLMDILQTTGVLNKSVIVLLSDHGTTLGLPGDRLIDYKTYSGDRRNLKLIPVSKKSGAPDQDFDFKNDYTINTSYGQGTDVLSLKQDRALLAFRGFGEDVPVQQINDRHALIDIAPTILDFLKLSSLPHIDGLSLIDYIAPTALTKRKLQPVFLETGDTIGEIESDKIDIQKVVKLRIGAYQINASNGLMFLSPSAEQSLIENKQRAILWGDWLLAKYPTQMRSRLVPAAHGQLEMESYLIKPYFVLVNVKSGIWTIGLTSDFAKTAPVPELLHKLKAFYGVEL
jgi:arylsulfatase A-like enzyme